MTMTSSMTMTMTMTTKNCPAANDDSQRCKLYGDSGVRVLCILSEG